jgi:GINS complex subunit 2
MNNANDFIISPSKLEFLCGEKPVTIVPNFTEPSLVLMERTYGPFRAQKPIEVPLWLAVYLKNRSKCKITVPIYFYEENLVEILQNETKNKFAFYELPPEFFETFQVIFENAEDDFDNSLKIKSLIENIKQIRISKLNTFIKSLDKKDTSFILNNITSYELNIFRPILVSGFNKFAEFDTK